MDLDDKTAGAAAKYRCIVSDKDKFKTKIAKCLTTMKSLHSSLWQLFKNLLGPALIPEWQESVLKETTQDGYIAKNGVRMTRERGQTNTALEACIRSWSLLVMSPNAAKRHCMYTQVQIVMYMRRLTVKRFIARVVEMNNYLKYLPFLKDLEDSLAKLTHADVPFSGMELCYIILNVIPYWLNCAYWAKQKANYFPINVEKMTEERVLLEPHYGHTQQLMDRIGGQAKQ